MPALRKHSPCLCTHVLHFAKLVFFVESDCLAVNSNMEHVARCRHLLHCPRSTNLLFFAQSFTTPALLRSAFAGNSSERLPYSARLPQHTSALKTRSPTGFFVDLHLHCPRSTKSSVVVTLRLAPLQEVFAKRRAQALCTPRTSYSSRQFATPRKQICALFVTFILHRFCTHTFVNKQACDGVCVVCMCVLYQCAHSTYIELRQASDS